MNDNYGRFLTIALWVFSIVLIVVMTITGCSVETEAAVHTPSVRFAVEDFGNGCSIITDNETGVQYLYYYESITSYHDGSGLCKLED